MFVVLFSENKYDDDELQIHSEEDDDEDTWCEIIINLQ